MQATLIPELNIVMGYPLEHSQSPYLHNMVYKIKNLPYIMLPAAHQEIESLVQAIKTFAVRLTAVTMPFKKTIVGYLDDLSPEVSLLKTANTILQKEGKLFGYNTDIAGIAFAFSGITLANKTALILGAGGAAEALGYFLQREQVNLLWLNRDQKKASLMATRFGGEAILSALDADIIINTTPVGMYPQIAASLLPDDFFKSYHIVFDMVYNPVFTRFLQAAEQQQAQILTGLDMFIGQALQQIALLTGQEMADSHLIAQLKASLIAHQRGLSS